MQFLRIKYTFFFDEKNLLRIYERFFTYNKPTYSFKKRLFVSIRSTKSN